MFYLQIFRKTKKKKKKKKNVLVYIHDYANELICIFEYGMNGQCLILNLVLKLSLSVEYRL